MGRPCMKSIYGVHTGETLYEESSVYMVYMEEYGVHTMGRPTYYGETLYEEFSVYMVYILWGDLV